MAAAGEDVEYESDPEDVPLPSIRRREASDDEDAVRSDGGEPARRDPRAARIQSDAESDGQGGAQLYDDEEFDEEEGFGEEGEGELDEYEEGGFEEFGAEAGVRVADPKAVSPAEVPKESGVQGSLDVAPGESYENQAEDGEGKKENEPYAVPTAGAFYMHDDRFQENGRGRRRRMFGGRKLWDPKDERAWVHDRFEEMNLQDTRYNGERRGSKGHFRGRGGGKTRDADRAGYRGSKSHSYYDDSNNQNQAPKVVRGRGPRRYETLTKNKREISASQYKQSAKPQEATSKSSTVQQHTQSSHVEPEPSVPRKQFASSLNYASPPFYPSGSSNQDLTVAQRRDAHRVSGSKVLPSSMQMEHKTLMPQSGSALRGKTVVDSGGHNSSYVDDALQPVPMKTVASSPIRSGFILSSSNPSQSSNPRFQGVSLGIGGTPTSQSTPSTNQVSRISSQVEIPQIHAPVVQQRPLQVSSQLPLRTPTQLVDQHPGSGNQAPPLPETPSASITEDGEPGLSPNSSKPKAPMGSRGKGSNQGSGRGPLLYGGAQVVGGTGAVGRAHGEQSFPGTPALLPVMQFGGQQHGGLGVPTVGMALPGYVSQQQLGFGNSEMTWLPVLAGAAGALGTPYCSPYIALDPSYYNRSSGQSSSVSSRETGPSKGANSPSRHDLVNEEVEQRQSKPRRYSEMNFGQ